MVKKFNIMSEKNGKLDKDGICAINQAPIMSCPFAGVCKAFCYAYVGRQGMGRAKDLRIRNYKLWKKDPKKYEELAMLDFHQAGRIINRWHDSGDIPDIKYLEMMIRIAEHYNDRKFYTYTKSIPFILEIGWKNLPQNLKLIQSFGGKADHLIDKSKPFAKVFRTEEEIPEDWTNASHSDLEAATTGMKMGIKVHGIRFKKFKG